MLISARKHRRTSRCILRAETWSETGGATRRWPERRGWAVDVVESWENVSKGVKMCESLGFELDGKSANEHEVTRVDGREDDRNVAKESGWRPGTGERTAYHGAWMGWVKLG